MSAFILFKGSPLRRPFLVWTFCSDLQREWNPPSHLRSLFFSFLWRAFVCFCAFAQMKGLFLFLLAERLLLLGSKYINHNRPPSAIVAFLPVPQMCLLPISVHILWQRLSL